MTGPRYLPDFQDYPDWEQRQLGELARKTGSGGTPSSRNREYYGGDIPFLSISDIQGRTVSKTQKHLTNKGLSASAAWIVPAGSITFSMYASYGKVAILGSPMATSQAFFNLVFDDSATRDFIFSQLESFSLRHKWDRIVSTGTQPNLTAGDLKQTLITLPSMEERTQIGKLFSTLDSLIAAAERQQELLKLQKLAYLQRMFPRNGEKKPRLRFPGFTGDWEQRQLKDVFTYERPDRVLTPNDCIEEQGKYPVLTANKTFVLGYTDNSQRIQNDIPRIIFDDFTMESKFADFPFSVRSSAIKLLKPRDKDNLYFLYLLLNTIHFPELGHARHYISYVQTQCVRVPNISEQNAIADLFKHFDSLIATTDSKIHALRRLKQGYMQQMFL